MKYELLINSIFRLPFSKANKALEYYQKNVGFKSSEEQQKALDIITKKNNINKYITDEIHNKIYSDIIKLNNESISYESSVFNNYDEYPNMFWIEIMDNIDYEILNEFLDKYVIKLPSFIIETIIINLPKSIQKDAVKKYILYINFEEDTFYSFYYSVKTSSRSYLKKHFKDKIPDDLLLEIKDMNENEIVDLLINNDELLYKNPNTLVEIVLDNITTLESLNIFIRKYNNLISRSSNSKFKMLFNKYKTLSKDSENVIDDFELIRLFKSKFYNLGVVRTIKLFDRIKYYELDEFTVYVVLELLDIAYYDEELFNIINKKTVDEIIKRYVEKCKSKSYKLLDLKKSINKISKEDKKNIISKEFIKTVIICSYLLNRKVIDDKNELYIRARELCSNDIIERCIKDYTLEDKVQLNSVFYRLIKGTLPFELVYSIKTYKGLIYLTKCGISFSDVDYVVSKFTDRQVFDLNVTQILRITKNIKSTKYPYLSAVDKMGLQLYSLFGLDKAKYLLESSLEYTRMENLFDQIKYYVIEIINGNPKLNEDFVNFLFGKGNMKEPSSNINKLIRGEIPEFEKYYSDFCNDFEKIVDGCNGVISVKRVIKYLDNVELPIELKPDELMFKPYLKEMNTFDSEILKEAVNVLKNARNRKYSTIPKFEGNIDDYRYEMLDLGDPYGLIVGYLTHCCFLLNGMSSETLKHALESKNGRVFVVYNKQALVAHSWVWRNGNVVCFDSIELGTDFHTLPQEEKEKLTIVYKEAAQKIMDISSNNEDEIDRVKLVSIGRTTSIFNDFETIKGEVPKPFEQLSYLFDSFSQKILVGNYGDNLKYKDVKVQYKDNRKKVEIIDNFDEIDVDKLDEVLININSLRYQLDNIEEPLDINNYKKIILGDGWYILFNKNGNIESNSFNDEDTLIEYNSYK